MNNENDSNDADRNAVGDADEAQKPDNVVHIDFKRGKNRGNPPTPASEVIEFADPRDKDKLKAFSELIENGMVMVTIDARSRNVTIPAQFRSMSELRLNFSHLFGIKDFEYDVMSIRASLSFDGKPYFCEIPWAAVTMLYGHESGAVVLFEEPE
ncbi:MAG: hypothetical protein H0U74_08000 [Bradymonadaceae bacterium]|nr:hypothetical protein [Lujinxingiaceae bacterium]